MTFYLKNKPLLVGLFLLCLWPLQLSAARVIVARPLKVIDRCGRGTLVDAGGTKVLLLAGSPYEMGYQHGKLLKSSVGELVKRVHLIAKMAEMGNANGFTVGTFEKVLGKTQKFIDRRFMDEMQGLADGAGLDLKDVQLANIFPEMFHCSSFALYGKATADGQMLHGRILDYMTEAGLQEHAVVIVAKPDNFNAFVNVGYAGLIGSVTGMNDKQITIGEMGGTGYGSWDGMPMTFLMRKALEEADTLSKAVEIFRNTPRTCEYYYVISDAKISDARGLACTSSRFDVFEPDHSYPQLPHAVKDAVLVSAKDRYEHLAAMVKQQFGKIDAAAALDLMNRPVAMKSCLHRVLFAPQQKVFWVANASVDVNDPNYAACFQPYYKYDFAELLNMVNEPNALDSQVPAQPKSVRLSELDLPKTNTVPKPPAMNPLAEKKEILTPAPGPAPKLNNPAVFGSRPGNPFVYRIPATGTRPMIFSVEGLPESLKLDTANGILTGSSPKKRGEYEMLFKAHNASGQDQRSFKLVVGDKLALTPPMGWNSWYIHYNRITDADMRLAADAMIASGMADYGYMYVNIDDCWAQKRGDVPSRDSCGGILTNAKFPDMKALTAYIHSRGLRAGLYTSPGPWTCTGYMGSYGYEQIDAQRFAQWGFDFLKYDACSYNQYQDKTRYEYVRPYALMGEILKNVNRDMVYNLCQYGMDKVWEWGSGVGGQTWRTMGDVGFMSFLEAGLRNSQYADYAGPGHWNDPDYILIGWVGDASKMGQGAPVKLSPNQQYQYMSMWSMMASPLFFSGDMTRLDDFTLNVLCNAEVIAVNQDILGRQGVIITKADDYFVMAKPLADGSIAVGLFNKSEAEISVDVSWQQLGLQGRQSVRDLWRQRDLGTYEERFETKLPVHGAAMLRLSVLKKD